MQAPDERDQAIARLFQTYAEFVWRVLRRFGVPEADAEDAVQEVFLVVSRRLDAYQEQGAMRAWLVSIARQVASHARRARFRQERKLQALPVRHAGEDPERTLENKRALTLVNQFLAQLDQDQAWVFYLAELEGLTAPEIAAGLQVNLNTVYARLRLARQRFEASTRKKLGTEY
jgi:RNA polymerase sigma-70 factor (ECF subfamily)